MKSDTKTCVTCGKAKGLNAFKASWNKRTKKNYLSGSCRMCINAKSREQYASDPDAYRARRRADHAKHGERRNAVQRERYKTAEHKERARARAYEWRYGITFEQRDAILAAQGGGCGICGTTDPGNGRDWCTDHDHACCPQKSKSCGQCIRGVLCFGCNVMLGCAKDSESTLRHAIEYLNQSNVSRRTPLAS